MPTIELYLFVLLMQLPILLLLLAVALRRPPHVTIENRASGHAEPDNCYYGPCSVDAEALDRAPEEEVPEGIPFDSDNDYWWNNGERPKLDNED